MVESAVQLYRVLSLRAEVQDEIQVLKPCLDNADVGRLCVALGSSSSCDDSGDEVDELFSRVVRRASASEGAQAKDSLGSVQVTGVFGRQSEVSTQLTSLGSWSLSVEEVLQSQGLYCLATGDTSGAVDALVLFVWLEDTQFQPQHLRGHTTYLLRFLTCLTDNIVVCLDERDYDDLARSMTQPSTHGEPATDDMVGMSLSVEYEDEDREAFKCVGCETLPLETDDYMHATLVDGSFLALLTQQPMPSRMVVRKQRATFANVDTFRHWIHDVARSHRVRIEHITDGDFENGKIVEQLLRAFNHWPGQALRQVHESFTEAMTSVASNAEASAQAAVEDMRQELAPALDVLYSPCKVTDSQHLINALQQYETFLEFIAQSDIGSDDQEVLRAPLRSKELLRRLQAQQKQHPKASLKSLAHSVFRNILFANHADNPSTESVEMSDAFNETRVCRERHSVVLKHIWLRQLQTLRDQRVAKDRVQEQKRHKAAIRSVLAAALQRLRAILCPVDSSKPLIDVRFQWKKTNGTAATREEVLEQQGECLKARRIDPKKPSMGFLGYLDRRSADKQLGSFTIQTRSMLVFSTVESRTVIERIQFEERPRVGELKPCPSTVLSSFGKVAHGCAFNLATRVVAFVHGQHVVLYKFTDAFDRVQPIHRMATDFVCTIASFHSIALLESAVLFIGENDEYQLVDRHSSRSSPVFQLTIDDNTCVWTSAPLLLHQGSVVVVVTLAAAKWGFQAYLHAASTHDHHKLPQLPIGPPIGSPLIQVASLGDTVYILDPVAGAIHTVDLEIAIHRDGCNLNEVVPSTSEQHRPATLSRRAAHWLWAFYHVFEKFPVRGLFECEDKAGRLRLHLVVRRGDQANHEARRAHSTRLRTLMERMMEELHDLNKPLCQLDLAGTMTFHDRVDSSVLANQLVCGLIRTLITFLPVQICRAADNRLTTMIDGLSPDQLVDSATETVADVARSIRFGVLSVLLESWPGKCVVVTSMGKQSTGKSYLLNHLTGASFATSGARCTDGAWLSVRIVSTDVLLVVVDFEGLGSFERTEQEDVLLSVLNSAISHFTIFRIEMRFDKDIDVMFSSFQKGVRLLRGEAQLFQGCLCMSIKDVNVNDQKGVLDEIRAKFRKLVATNKRDNFLSGMYCGKLELTCSPPTGTWGYHRALANTKHCLDKRLRDHPNLPYSSGKAFLDLLRLVIAKISVLDWTGVDESARQIRQTDVQRQLVGLLRCGCLVARDGDITERRLRKTPYTAATEAGVLCLHVLSSSYPTKATEWQRVAGDRGINFDALLDYDVDLGPLVTTVASTLDWEGLRDELERLHALFGGLCRRGRDNTDVLKPTHQSHFDAFLSFVLCRRVANVEHWVKEHEARAGAITDVWRTFEYQYVRRLLAAFARCQHPCHACQLGCMNAVNHPRDFAHDCRTSHHCNGYCEYCLEATEGYVFAKCSMRGGHNGRCFCLEGKHLCSQQCRLNGARNCTVNCVLVAGHVGDHRCAAQRHWCGQPCSASSCSGICTNDADDAHDRHDCGARRCAQRCSITLCREQCDSVDHFHDDDQLLASEHMCGSCHACPATCQVPGLCAQEANVSLSTFQGARDQFQYHQWSMTGVKHRCTRTLAPHVQSHDGQHACSIVEHKCGERCRQCNYYCTKPHGHSGRHATTHGSMVHMRFTAEDEHVDIKNRRYAAGETSVAEMCNIYCSSVGRGHVHFLPCNQFASDCVYDGASDGRRHCQLDLVPPFNGELDEVLHTTYWASIGWEDPCVDFEERRKFEMCAMQCDDPEHRRLEKPSVCVLPAWHEKAVNDGLGTRFAYVGGHKFICSHASATDRLHHVFVLDSSGSMRGNPWHHLCRAVKRYLEERLDGHFKDDAVSVITFADRASVVFEASPILSAVKKVTSLSCTGGGTEFEKGLAKANEVLSRVVNVRSSTPVLIFLSDGRPTDERRSNQLADAMKRHFAKYDLRCFVVAFGDADDKALKRFATRLGGSVRHALNGNELRKTFVSISKSLGARAGLVPNQAGEATTTSSRTS